MTKGRAALSLSIRWLAERTRSVRSELWSIRSGPERSEVEGPFNQRLLLDLDCSNFRAKRRDLENCRGSHGDYLHITALECLDCLVRNAIVRDQDIDVRRGADHRGLVIPTLLESATITTFFARRHISRNTAASSG